MDDFLESSVDVSKLKENLDNAIKKARKLESVRDRLMGQKEMAESELKKLEDECLEKFSLKLDEIPDEKDRLKSAFLEQIEEIKKKNQEAADSLRPYIENGLLK